MMVTPLDDMKKAVEENDDELELERGYVSPKRGRVLLLPLLVGGVYNPC